MKYRGVAYYPEYWPEERWDEDIRLMREARINLVRVGEFAWAAMEPAEGNYTLDWLHRLVEKMAAAEIGVLLCTPTAAPPAWLTSRYPDTLLVHEDGKRMAHGIRRHYCPTSPTYRDFSARITGVLSREFARHANLIGWQLDNEFGPERGWCHCEQCQAAFRTWLQARYGTLEELNRRWATRFWSMEFSAWEQVRMATDDMYPSIQLDTRRFKSQAYVDFAAQQAQIIRQNHPGVLITTNGMGPVFEPINYYDLFSHVDRAAADEYYDIATAPGNALACDLFRGYKADTPFWMTETGSGALTADKVPTARQLRTWAFSGWAHGCEAWCFFRWRTCLSGQEQELQGIIETSGKPRRRYQAVQALFKEIEELAPQLGDLPLPKAEVAILHDYDVIWGYRGSFINNHVQYKKLVLDTYNAFFKRQATVDLIPPERDFSGYRLLVLPSITMVDAELADRLRAFVQAGGNVLALPQLACRDRNNNYIPATPPVGLTDFFGLRVEGGMYLRSFVGADEALWFPEPHSTDQTPVVQATLAGKHRTAHTRTWMEDIELEGGTALGTYQDNDFAGCPAVVEHRTGSGSTLYCGAYPGPELLDALIDHALLNACQVPGPIAPPLVEVIRRGEVTFIINHGSDPVTLAITAERALVGMYRDGQARLGAEDVCVLIEER